MDPKACLKRALDALRDGNLDECANALEDYRTWRRKGGYEPMNGDSVERLLESGLLYARGEEGFFNKNDCITLAASFLG